MSGELALIDALRGLATHPTARNLDDDAAILEVGCETLILTHDVLAEGVHYLADQDPADIAWKLVATTLSDLAAKGAEPLGVMLGYQLGGDDARFVAGLGEALAHYRCALFGGDTFEAPGGKVLGLTALGRATHRPVPSRSGARAGDALYLTGALGAAMAGLEALKVGIGSTAAYRKPVALIAEGRALAPLVSAMMDVSDGLLLDADRLARASRVTVNIEQAAVPIAVPEGRRDAALRWGDDYQLLFTAPEGLVLPIAATRIGSVIAAGEDPLLLNGAAPEGQLGY